jgi:hypothetical protein
MSTDPRANEARGLKFYDPREVLMVPGGLEKAMAELTHGRKLSPSAYRKLLIETIDGAVFTLGMGELWKRPTAYSPTEGYNQDCLIAVDGPFGEGAVGGFGSVQLKQFGPGSTRQGQSLNEFLAELEGKYCDPNELYLAISVNRAYEIDLRAIVVPPRLREQVMELWLFGRSQDERSRWFFYGDMLDKPRVSFHTIQDVLPEADVSGEDGQVKP